MSALLTRELIWDLLDEVKDPEIPVVSIVEMGIARQVSVDEQKVTIILAPTFAGCPAINTMRDEVLRHLAQAGAGEVEVRFTYSPPWSSDDLTPQARQKLKAFGLATPSQHHGLIEPTWLLPVPCPYCDSTNTSVKNEFGPTLCRAIYFCYNCNQPFERFKPV
jgi:ring-1,2-phenylacetyl-CoA epoxidase subunit PaaD